jgi:hypothetical protein
MKKYNKSSKMGNWKNTYLILMNKVHSQLTKLWIVFKWVTTSSLLTIIEIHLPDSAQEKYLSSLIFFRYCKHVLDLIEI